MHGPRPARRTFLPFVLALGALALGALALAFYVAAYLLAADCDPAISVWIPLVAGALCVAAAITLGLLGYRKSRERDTPHGSTIFAILIPSVGSFVLAFAACFGNAPFFCGL